MTKKTCVLCEKRGKSVRARESNTTAVRSGGRRCVCRNGCKPVTK